MTSAVWNAILTWAEFLAFLLGGDKQQLAQHEQLWGILSKLAFGEQRIVSGFGSEIFLNKWQMLK